MDTFRIEGPVRLSGTVSVNGSKNAALPIMAAAILAPGKSVLKGAPRLSDISVFAQLLDDIGCKVTTADTARHKAEPPCGEVSPAKPADDITIDSTSIGKPVGEYDIVRKMRAGICILGPLLARCGKAKVSMPGGCAIGYRPVDIHLRGLRELGVHIDLENGYIVADATKGLRGREIFLGGPFGSTVLGTANVMMAATLAKGKTIIESAACEPEVTDLANCLNKMGAKITAFNLDVVVN